MEPTEPTLPLFVAEPARPLADRLRPTRLDDVVGQDHLLAPDAPLGRMVAQQRLGSAILWGPPGVGKTTIARLLADGTNLAFEPVSATFSGVADLRKVFAAARKQRNIGQGTLLFVYEIHRFNRTQQDSFLPYVEDGTISLIGATTENPSFDSTAPSSPAPRSSYSNASTKPPYPPCSTAPNSSPATRCPSTTTPAAPCLRQP